MRLEPTQTYCVGVDLGSADGGICGVAPDGDVSYRKAFHVVNPKEKPLDEKLLLLYDFLADAIRDALSAFWNHQRHIHPRTVIGTESVSVIPGRPRAALVLPQCVGILRAVVWETSRSYRNVYPDLILVTPGQAKVALTGKGNASKLEMVAWAQGQTWQHDWTEDEADAYGIALAAQGWVHQEAMKRLAEEQAE